MALTTASANRAFLPEQVGDLVVRPVEQQSVALQVSDVDHPGRGTNHYRIPIVSSDPTAAWTSEGGDISPTDATLTEVHSDFLKLAALTIVSRELVEDSTPQAAEIVGKALARDIAKKLDTAFFGTNVTSAGPPVVRDTKKPQGLLDIAPNDVEVEDAWTNIDPFIEAIYDAEAVGAQVGHFVANPADALELAQLKRGTGSNETLLQPDPTLPTRRTIGGVPLLVSPAVTTGTIWGIPQDRSIIALREDVTLAIDSSRYFESDRVGIRATARVALLFPHETAIQKITLVEGDNEE